MTKLYRVNFETKMGGYKHWVIDIEANTLKEAREKAEQMWYKVTVKHMFHTRVRVLKDTEEFLYNYFDQATAE